MPGSSPRPQVPPDQVSPASDEDPIDYAARAPEKGVVRTRAYVVGTVALLVNQIWLVQVEAVRWSLFTDVVPFCNVICTLALLVLINAIGARVSPSRQAPLTRAELLCIFVMSCIGSALGSAQMGHLLVAYLVYPFRFAGAGNRWGDTFMQILPNWAMVSDKTAVANFYVGNSSFFSPANFRPWIVPIVFWVFFIVVLLWTMLCVNTILRRQWQVAERLSYPTIYLPLEMTSGPTFWQNRALWAGIALAGGLTIYNGFAFFYPNIPMLPIKRIPVEKMLFTTPPWGGFGNSPGGTGTIQTGFYFFAIGLAFLMPKDISFSLWFFYILYKLELVAVTALGYGSSAANPVGFSASPPYESAQAFGAYAAVFVTAVVAARPHLRDVWRTAFGRGPKPLDDSDEPLRYRTAIIGAFVGGLAIIVMCVALRMSPVIAVVFLGLYFLITIVVTRIRAEFGFPVHDMSDMGPMNPMLSMLGTTGLGARNIVGLGMTWWFNRTYFASPAPHQLEAMKCAEVSGSPQRAFLKAMILASFVGGVGVFMAYLPAAYHLGASTARMERWPLSFPIEIYNHMGNWIQHRGTVNHGAQQAMVGGFVFALIMGALRQKLTWFPLHPLGYAVACSWGMQQLWMPIMIGSLCKIISLRVGGLSFYRRAVPFFLGLILGEMIIGSMWTLVGIGMGVRAYDFWP